MKYLDKGTQMQCFINVEPSNQPVKIKEKKVKEASRHFILHYKRLAHAKKRMRAPLAKHYYDYSPVPKHTTIKFWKRLT